EGSVASKWVDLLKQMAPSTQRVAFLFNPDTSPQSRFFLSAAQADGRRLGVEIVPAPIKSFEEVEPTLARLAREPNSGLVVPPDDSTFLHVEAIVNVVARHRISAIYAGGEYTAVGGLMQYHRDPLEAYRQVPYYIDRVFRGTKPGDLPIQMPTK